MASRVQKGFEPGSRLYQPPQLHLRGSFSRFATGVAVVSFEASGGRHAITVNSFTSVSMDPPLVLVSIAKTTKTHDELFDRPFTVNILGAEQEDLAKHFSGRPNRDPVWVEGPVAPRLSGVLAWFCCTPWANYEGGDHTLFLGEVQEYDYRRGDALGFVGGRFVSISENPAGHESLI